MQNHKGGTFAAVVMDRKTVILNMSAGDVVAHC